MAEYYISYNDLRNITDEYIAQSESRDLLERYKAEILAALTGDFEQNNLDSAQEMITLWENQTQMPSQLLLGTRYIRVQQSMIDLLKTALTSGVIEAIILYETQGNSKGFTVSLGLSIAIKIWDLFNDAKTLDDWDFCIYMQAVTHFKKHKGFTMKEIREWMPTVSAPNCNMHNSTWNCDYLNDDDTCSIREEQKLDYAIKSLCDKELLAKSKDGNEYVFKFNV